MLRLVLAVIAATLLMAGSMSLLSALGDEPGGNMVVARGPVDMCGEVRR